MPRTLSGDKVRSTSFFFLLRLIRISDDLGAVQAPGEVGNRVCLNADYAVVLYTAVSGVSVDFSNYRASRLFNGIN